MNDFERQVNSIAGEGLGCVNIGLRRNQKCQHYHLEASPQRPEMMDWPTMETVQEAAKRIQCHLIDLTGGAPELNPYFRTGDHFLACTAGPGSSCGGALAGYETED